MRTDDFRALVRKLSILLTELDIFDMRQRTYSLYLLMSHLLSFIISNTVKREFRSMWK